MEPNEQTIGTIWCNPTDASNIKNRIVSEIKENIWSDSIPKICPSTTNNGIEMFNISLVHGGDIIDDSLLALILIKISGYFENCYTIVQTTEGDLFLIETLSKHDEDLDLDEDIVSIAKGSMLYYVSEQYSKSNECPKHATPFQEKIQETFNNFIENTKKEELFHNMKVLIPSRLARMIRYEPQLISEVVKFAEYSKKVNFKDYKLSESVIKMRKYHAVVLDSRPIKVPQEFSSLCKEKSSRFIRISYLLICSYMKMAEKYKEIDEISNKSDFDYLDSKEITEDDDKWLDSNEKPEGDYEEIGDEMAERFKTFVSEFSQFDKIENDGSIGFDAEEFAYKLEHFLDSTDYEEEEEIDEEDFENMLNDDDDKILVGLSKNKEDQVKFATDNWNESLNSQPTSNGPTTQYMNLFDLS
ncbi:hypothetical protein TVAG_017950 [Trichomonas vaginalis G3]|uniref:Uncharacterized protein n=1 Tax=Trichomonas vaginalis (strain ATCC PRA-98 / G3) TaxID=412133 RepID=A2FET4_TRIV3|nr:hypothetical protein TVAGG3_0932040 [Trichomonas vaginalis G3]EAX96581.1 hypothetical protein TVAG_017950 [Trichomonas vaginalis G3]KAI5485907.1 hypothetical protein TVAGG3_0932040 [Trichomonas vaginalis G3]|eukprot:XP_001309511.1 hypothetical protein [Trichomonas vaginalis G3]